MKKCLLCKTEISSYEIYTDWFHCLGCNKDFPYNPHENDDMEKIVLNDGSILYRNTGYQGPVAIDMKPSQELIDYHNNSEICLNHQGKTYLNKIKDIHGQADQER